MMVRTAKRYFVVVGLYTLLTVGMTMPGLLYTRDWVVGVGGDPWQSLWRFSYKYEVLTEAWHGGHFGQFLLAEFFGQTSPALVNLSVWPWMWLYGFFGLPTAYNVVWFLSFVLAGISMYQLTRYLLLRQPSEAAGGSWLDEAPAFLAGVAYMFWPYHVAQSLGHFGAMQLHYLPWLILCMYMWLHSPGFILSFIFSLLFVLQAWSEHHYVVWFGIFGIVWFGFNWRQVMDRFRTRRGWQSAALAAVLSLFFAGMSYAPTIRLAIGDESQLALGREQLLRFSADVFSYILPAPFHSLWGGISQFFFTYRFSGNDIEATHFLGLSLLLLVLFFHQAVPRAAKTIWITVAAVFFVVSLGPRLQLLGATWSVPLPYAFIDSWPVFSAIRTVGRASVMVGLSLCVLVALVLRAHMHRSLSVVLVLLIILAEFLFFPVPMQRVVLSPAYAMVRDAPGARMIELPAATNYAAASRALYASRGHDKEVVGSIALERGSDTQDFKLLRSIPGIRQLLYMRSADLRSNKDDFFGQALPQTFLEATAWLDVGSILIHIDSLSREQQGALREFLEADLGMRAREWDDALLYSLGDATPLPTDGVFLMREDGWQAVRYIEADEVYAASIVRQATAGVINVTDAPLSIELSFTVDEGSHGNVMVMLDDTKVGQFESQSGRQRIRIRVEGGYTQLHFINQLAEPVRLSDPQLKVVGV